MEIQQKKPKVSLHSRLSCHGAALSSKRAFLSGAAVSASALRFSAAPARLGRRRRYRRKRGLLFLPLYDHQREALTGRSWLGTGAAFSF